MLGNGKSYDGLPLWRGMDEWYVQQTAYLRLGWAMGLVDQIVPITDFCSRNEIALFARPITRSCHTVIGPIGGRFVAAVPALDSLPYCGPAWFALDGPGPWHFPSVRRSVAEICSSGVCIEKADERRPGSAWVQ